jgi:hypothetical protein
VLREFVVAQQLLDGLHIFFLMPEERCKQMPEGMPSDALVNAGGHRGRLQMILQR